jgi:hypothetical protein
VQNGFIFIQSRLEINHKVSGTFFVYFVTELADNGSREELGNLKRRIKERQVT